MFSDVPMTDFSTSLINFVWLRIADFGSSLVFGESEFVLSEES